MKSIKKFGLKTVNEGGWNYFLSQKDVGSKLQTKIWGYIYTGVRDRIAIHCLLSHVDKTIRKRHR